MSEAEKRAHDRLRVRYSVRIEIDDDGAIEGTVENLGALGVLVTTPEIEVPLEAGNRVSLSITLADNSLVVAKGEILRIDQELADGEIRRALAVRFDQPIDA